MAVTKPSMSSLSNYSILQDPNTTPVSRDFCNSFWGEADEGANVLFARMRTAVRTSEELQNFWTQRAAIEEEFGKRLSVLSRMPVGVDETGELKTSLQALIEETQRQADSHIKLASNIRRELVESIARFHDKQIDRKRSVQAPIEKKFKAKQSQASYVAKAREKYEGDISRIRSYRQQAGQLQGQDLDRLQNRLRRALETVKANEKDYAGFLRGLSDLSAEWEVDWKGFCDNCQDLEEERMEFMKDNLWNYANMISMICVSDDESCERVRTALDLLEPERDLLAFVEAHGTGNRVTDPPPFVSIDPQKASTITSTSTATPVRTVLYDRVSRKPEAVYQNASTPPIADVMKPTPQNPPASIPPPVQPTQLVQPVQPVNHNLANGAMGPNETVRYPAPSITTTTTPAITTNPPAPPTVPVQPVQVAPAEPTYKIPPPPPIPEEPPRNPSRAQSLRRKSGPLPHPPGSTSHAHVQEPLEPPVPTQPFVPITERGDRILFLVKALYDYKATIDEEFDFQAEDIIAVTETPDDGWWSGELLDEARRVPGRHIFPSNYVCLF